MAKRIFAFLLTICLLAVALPTYAAAEKTVTEAPIAPQHEFLVRQINRCYQNTLSATGEPNMDQLCGTFVAYQLYFLKITNSAAVANGSEFYAMYARQGVTSGGHKIRSYSGQKYSIEEALNAITHNGTKDAYNIMLCFDWTRSGGSYGHVMLIHAIIGGTVYAVDNFTTSIAGPEGTPMIASIARFADQYDGWSSFEGAVEFGVKDYASLCSSYTTDMFVRALEPSLLLTQPAPVGEQDCLPARVVAKGERLFVTDVLVDGNLKNYYRVREGGLDYYIEARLTQPIRLNTEGLQWRNVRLETALEVGQKGGLTGEIFSTGSVVGKVELLITDSKNQQVWHSEIYEPRFNHKLDSLQVDLSGLPRGAYGVKLYATIWNYYDNNGIVENQNQKILVLEESLYIGNSEIHKRIVPAFAPVMKHSWLYEDGLWRCYRNGVPRTGWYCYDGIDYYLKEDGSVTTGWANINGEDRFFSDTGAMRTGWLVEDNGDVRYMLFNGISAKGWRQIDGETYYFDENGILDINAIPEE